MKKAFLLLPLLSLISLPSSLNKTPVSFSGSIKNRAQADTTLNATTALESNVLSPVYVNTSIDCVDELKALEEKSPTISNVIIYIDNDLNVTDKDGNSLGLTFKEVYSTYLKGKYIPVIYINDEETQNAFITYIDETSYIVDSAICSSNPEIVKAIRSSTSGKKIRGIIDYSGVSKDDFVKEDVVKEVNKSFANTVILNDDLADEETIFYFEARFKCVWTSQSNFNKLNLISKVNDGIYGILTKNYEDTIAAFEDYKNSPNVKRNVNRVSLNIAHRGMCTTNYENSMEAFVEAYEKGATHIELDVQVTADEKLVVMHDSTLGRTTNYSGSKTIAEMTSEEIKNYRITKSYSGADPKLVEGGVEIPFLDEVFEKFKDNGKIIIVELKDSNANLVPLLKTYLDEYDIYDQVVCISFYETQLAIMKEQIPEIPCATLNSYTSSMLNKITSDGVGNFNTNNFTTDLNYGGCYSADFDRQLAERGFLGFYWTFAGKSDIYDGLSKGIFGITNNAANEFSSIATKLVVSDDTEITYDTTVDLDSYTFAFNYLTYDGNTSEATLDAKIISYEEDGDYLNAIFGAEYSTAKGTPRYRGVVFSDIVRVKKVTGTVDPDPVDPDPVDPTDPTDPTEPTDNTGKKGCGGSVVATSITLSIIALLAGVLMFILRRKEKSEK